MSNPDKTSEELAELLSGKLGREKVNGNWFRQTLLRAREQFVERLLSEVARSLGTADPDEIEAELADLDLLQYCEPLLKRRKGGTPPRA